MLRPRLHVATLSLLLLVSGACSKKSDAPGSAPPAAPSASGATNADPLAADAATAAPSGLGSCKVDVAPFVVDKNARGETGVTLARLPDDRLAVGYASGDGTPRVAVLSADGSASVVDVDTSKVPELAQRLPGKGARTIHRVTPIAAKELKVRVAVDFTETRADGTRLVRCGAADEEPLARFEGRSAYDGAEDGGAPSGRDEVRDCRSFAERGAAWTLAFEAHAEAGAIEARWRVGAPSLDDGQALLDHHAVPAEAGRTRARAAQVDRYGYTLLASAKLGDAGYVVASRTNGRLLVAKRAASWAAEGDAGDFWLGTAIGMPSIAVRDARVVVLAPLSGKLDLYGAAFPAEAKVSKPEKLEVVEPAGQAPLLEGAERTAVSAAIAPGGRVFATFLDGKPGKRRARVASFTETLKPIGTASDAFGSDVDALDVKAVALDDERLLVTALVTRPGAAPAVEATVLRCAPSP